MVIFESGWSILVQDWDLTVSFDTAIAQTKGAAFIQKIFLDHCTVGHFTDME